MAAFAIPRSTILSLAAAIVIGASPVAASAAQPASSANDIPEGLWSGLLTVGEDGRCTWNEKPIKATVTGRQVKFQFGPPERRTILQGDIDAEGKVSVSEILAHLADKGIRKEIAITGQFSGHSFAGTYKIGSKTCRGKIAVAPTKEMMAAISGTREGTRSPAAGSAAVDEAKFWQEIQHSTNVSDFVTYLQKYPKGIFVPLAESQMRALVARQGNPAGPDTQGELAGIDFGRYHALVIGINNYANLPKLKTAADDAKAIAALLEQDYGFKVRLLIDPSRTAIVDAFDDYLRTLTSSDNLLIYYAGHGWLDRATDRGYWLPVDAQEGRRSHWLSNATIIDTLKSLAAKHVIVVADSCFSGTLTRSATVGLRDKNYLRRMAEKQARVAMVSGGLEPVADDAGRGNSPFAKAFMAALRNNRGVIDGIQLFGDIRRPVMLDAKQTPEYSDVRNAGHDGGDFLFVRKK